MSCESCHHASFVTSVNAQYDFLSYQTIYPHTDMLLHDMGEGLADHRPDFKADGHEWRTPPLWGIGLTFLVGGHQSYLHDGRARSLEEAIMWHGGEGQHSKEGFSKLSSSDRKALIKYLESL
ncbi:MAG: di-heme oxidoredictase family protein [Saprospiraceae bacterium]